MKMAQIIVRTVAVAGSAGTLGPVVITQLVRAGFKVTALSRDSIQSKKLNQLPAEVKIVQADYSSVDALKTVLQADNFDSLVILINRNQPEAQINVIDAAISAGIPHIIPSCFGLDTTRKELREIPSLRGKIQMEDHLFAKANDGLVTYTAINTGALLDWALDLGVFVNLKGGPTVVYSGGDGKISATLIPDVAKTVVAVLKHRKETENRVLFVHSAVTTQNKLLEYGRAAAPQKEFPVVPKDAEQLLKEGWEQYNAGLRSVEVMRKFLIGSSYGKGNAFFERVDNELLGLKMLSEDELRGEVGKRVKDNETTQ